MTFRPLSLPDIAIHHPDNLTANHGNNTMKSILFVCLIALFNLAYAEPPLSFPTTEAEIVQALTPQPVRQRKGFAAKGVSGIKQDNPKVGALILFEFDSASIQPASYPLLREFANALEGGLADADILITGHTDNMGAPDYNFWLSERRAKAVKSFLVSVYQIEDNRLSLKAYGESQPIESNETEQGRQQNRRVEFIRQ